jgi:serralysin
LNTCAEHIMHGLTRHSLLGAAAGLIAIRDASVGDVLAQVGQPAPITHNTFDKKSVELRPFVGRNVALLLNPYRTTDRVVIGHVLSAIDRAWDWYRGYFGREPTPHNTHAGKTAIAEVSGTCGAACGLLGFTGIEMSTGTINRLLIEANLDRYNQAVFYELGRNFWFFADPLQAMPKGAFTTGYAHVHRFYSMEAAGLVGAPWDDNLDFDGFRQAILVELMDRYLDDRTLTWENTLGASKVPKNPYPWIAVDHLAAAFFHRIRRDHGHAGYRQFWQLMAKAPKSTTPRDAAARFVQVARTATGQDYRELLRDTTLPLAL